MWFFLVLLIIGIVTPLPLQAQSMAPVINEIAWMGTEVAGVDASQQWRYEWIELYNPTEQSISLDGWSLELHRTTLDFRVPLSGTIEAGQYFLVGSSHRLAGLDINYANLGGKFINGGQRLVLRNAQGIVIEELDAREGWFAGDTETKQTMERRFVDIGANEKENWGNSELPGGTMGEQNSVFMQAQRQTTNIQEREVESFSSFQEKRGFIEPLFSFLTGPFSLALLLAVLSAAAVLLLRFRLQE